LPSPVNRDKCACGKSEAPRRRCYFKKLSVLDGEPDGLSRDAEQGAAFAPVQEREFKWSRVRQGLRSKDILRLLFLLDHQDGSVPRLDSSIDLAPEHLEVVDSGCGGAAPHQP